MILSSGILILIVGIIHIVYGEIVQIPGLEEFIQDPIIIGSTRVMIFQGGIILIAIGAIQILKGLKIIKLKGIGALFPLGIICLNFGTFLLIALITHIELLSISIPQILIFSIIIILLVLSLLKERRQEKV